MQASVHRYGGPDGETTLVTDEGRTLACPPALLRTAGLRTLRIGQRLAVTLAADGAVAAVAIPAAAPRDVPATQNVPAAGGL